MECSTCGQPIESGEPHTEIVVEDHGLAPDADGARLVVGDCCWWWLREVAASEAAPTKLLSAD